MNRGYSREWFLQIVDKLRAARPGIVFSTDIIVGFPGETDAEFAETAALMRAVEFEQAYIFKYSKRQDTPAAAMPGQVNAAVKEERNLALNKLLTATMLRRNRQLVGQTVEVLVEGRSAKNPRRLFGRTRTNKGVVFEGNDQQKGTLVPVPVKWATDLTLYGTGKP